MNSDRMAAAKASSSRGEVLLLELESGLSPSTFRMSDFPTTTPINMSILNTADVWQLKRDGMKYQFLFTLMMHKREEPMENFVRKVDKLKKAMQLKEQLRNVSRTEALKKKRVIGVTITGASINHDLLQQVGPKVVIVEEAAEIMESSLIAALGKNVRHLIMIGDHKQLRPQVDTWELKKDYNLDVSMMERLIRSQYPFKALNKQNRMRPEFSALLKDIYPHLEDNTERVAGNVSIDCLTKSMFFWSHHCPEETKNKEDLQQSRSKRNEGEADMVVTLAFFMLMNGASPSQITILAAYQGQTVMIRKKLKEKRKELFSVDRTDDFVQVHTIDMFQGDENDYVIVSLVRSNNDGELGFLREMNRRCVAQSRAKCGLYLVGNVDTVTNSKGKKSVWAPLVNSMRSQKCVGTSLQIQCPRHKCVSIHSVANKNQLSLFIKEPTRLCNVSCGEKMPCDVHNCKLPCSPAHGHHTCLEVVDDKHDECGHPFKRKCFENRDTIPCEIRVDIIFDECNHPGKKKCYVDKSKLTCQKPCEHLMECENHLCPEKCGNPHNHVKCQAKVYFEYPDCGHNERKLCYEEVSTKTCIRRVEFKFTKCGHIGQKACYDKGEFLRCMETVNDKKTGCGHEIQKKCHQDARDIKCHQTCIKIMDCTVHECTTRCGSDHGHGDCRVKVKYSFPDCKHESPMMKGCSELITWKCKFPVFGKAKCGHMVRNWSKML